MLIALIVVEATAPAQTCANVMGRNVRKTINPSHPEFTAAAT